MNSRTHAAVQFCSGAPRLADDFRSSDTASVATPERIRALAQAHGAKRAAASLLGDFALALSIGNDDTMLATDRFSVRSLCYRVVDGKLQVAARADELARIEPAAPIDLQAVFDYLYFHVIPSPRTIFAGVFRLPPACFAVFGKDAPVIAPYWEPEFLESDAVPFSDRAEQFKTLLKAAVARQLDGSKPACFLSGGTDSSTVAGMIGAVTEQQAHTYSIGFEAEGYDEMAYARIAARHFGTKHNEYYVTPDDVLAGIPIVAQHYDQPFGNSSALPAYYCAKLARDDGVTRLLAGDGGDELFGGNARYAKQRVFDEYARLPAALRRHVLEPALLRTRLGAMPLLRKGASYLGQAVVPMPDRLQMYNLLLRLGLHEVLTPQFLAQIDVNDVARQQHEVWARQTTNSVLNRTLAFDWRYTLAEADLPKVVGTTHLAGIAVGFPFLDQRLVEFSTALPADYKVKGLKLRWFFKEALRGFLPEEIIRKRKQGFGLPFGVWTTRHPGLRRLAEESLRSLSTRGIVRASFIEALLRELLPAHPGYYGEMVWILTMLEHWLNGHAPGLRIEA